MNYYDKLIFYKFLSLARVKNTQNCIHWAMVAQGARYARGISNTKSPEQVFFGTSTHTKTMMRHVDELKHKMQDSLMKILSERETCLVTLDNNQKGFPIKNPRYGVNNKYITVTGRTFVEFLDGNSSCENVHTELTYHKQKIISVLRQPHFESIYNNHTFETSNIVAVMKGFGVLGNHGMPVDITGNRVEAYAILVGISYVIADEQQYCSGYNASENEFKIWKHQKECFRDNVVRKRSMKIFASQKRMFFQKAISFQKRHTLIWNDKLKQPTKLFVPCVSTYDEMKLCEYGMAIIEVMELAGLIVKEEYSISDKGRTRVVWKLGEHYKKRHLYFYG